MSPISRSEYLRNKRKRLFWKIGLCVAGLVFCLGILSFLSYRRAVRVSAVELSGGVLVTRAEVEREALSYLSGTYFWLFPRDNSTIYDKNGLVDYLKDKFKRIDYISIGLKNAKTISVNITERKPQSLWCQSLPESSNDGSCYFMDSNGTIFAEAPHFSGDAYFKYYGLLASSTAESPIGLSYIASSTQFRNLTEFISRLKEMRLVPQYLNGEEGGQFSLTLAGGTKILFDDKMSLDKLADNISIISHSAPFSDPSRVGEMAEYIDLRFGNKLYYKIRSNESR